MKSLFFLVLLVVLCACSDAPSLTTKKNPIDVENEVSKASIIINGSIFQVININERFYCLLNRDGDTIIPKEDYYFQLEILDFDDDGFEDLRVFVMSNEANQCDNYWFDSSSEKFKKIENCDLNFEKIKGKDYCFTYYGTGCADGEHTSDLYKMNKYNFKLVGQIIEKGCEFDTIKEPKIAKIYTYLNDSTDKLIKTYKLYEFEGAHSYWEKNCSKFDY